MIRRRNRRSFPFGGGQTGWRHISRQKSRGEAPRTLYRRPNVLVGSLCDVVSSCQVWFGSVHFCRSYGGKTLPEEDKVNTIAWLRLAKNKNMNTIVPDGVIAKHIAAVC